MKNAYVAVLAAVLLTALISGCTTGGTDTASTTQPSAAAQKPAGGGASAPQGQFIAKTSEVPAGSSKDFTYNGNNAILVNFNGVYKAYVNSCTHKGCATKFSGTSLDCPCHKSRFDPGTGAAIKGPATLPLTMIDVTVVGDGIYAK